MEPRLPCGSDHSGSTSGSKSHEEKTPKVPGDGDDCVSSDWTKETPEQGDSEEDEYEKVNTTTWTRYTGKMQGLCGVCGRVAFRCNVQKRGVGPDSFWQAAETAEDTKVII